MSFHESMTTFDGGSGGFGAFFASCAFDGIVKAAASRARARNGSFFMEMSPGKYWPVAIVLGR
jgi:hypothetical protein